MAALLPVGPAGAERKGGHAGSMEAPAGLFRHCYRSAGGVHEQASLAVLRIRDRMLDRQPPCWPPAPRATAWSVLRGEGGRCFRQGLSRSWLGSCNAWGACGARLRAAAQAARRAERAAFPEGRARLYQGKERRRHCCFLQRCLPLGRHCGPRVVRALECGAIARHLAPHRVVGGSRHRELRFLGHFRCAGRDRAPTCTDPGAPHLRR
mmetsp:Transcript_65881/g.140964  ORF Transcript_65881/g.140964 Transcript_65881/m.140964 type:complete len:208 (-) Transcript_65881:1285-1908(-)